MTPARRADRWRAGALAALLGSGAIADSNPNISVHPDEPLDAKLRLTDPGEQGYIPNLSLPDILSVSLSGWASSTATTDPYRGWAVQGESAHLGRLDLVIRGRVCPPGSLGMAGLPYLPDEYGTNPIFGYVEIDVDEDINTGGEFGGVAANRYLANVGRFGIVPRGALGLRTARAGVDIDLNFATGPQYERNGADFVLSLCGCFHTTIVQRITGDSDNLFEDGETWVVRGRFFQRAGGYEGASFAFGGSALGMYDPLVNLRFSHDAAADRTTITLVHALDQRGASILSGQPEQPIDSNVANHTSVEEALEDVIEAISFGAVSGPAFTLASAWAKREAGDYLEPMAWGVRALVGSAYITPMPTLYAWTDTLGDERFGDLTSDGAITASDRAAFSQALALLDGGPSDCDGSPNGSFTICTPGPNWSVLDLNGDARVDALDFDFLREPCLGDINADHFVDFLDLGQLLTAYGEPVSFLANDLNTDGVIDFLDLNILLSVFGQPCP